MATRWGGRLPAACAALALLTACQSTPETGANPLAAGVGDELLVTSSASGDECRIRMTGQMPGDVQVEQFDIHCKGWQEPSGLIWRMPLIDKPQLTQMLLDDKLPLWQMTKATCDPVQETTIAGRIPALIRPCKSDEGWPYLLIGLEHTTRGETYLAWGLPHLAGTFEQFVLLQIGEGSDAQWRKAGSRSQLLLLAQQEINFRGNQLTLANVQDYKQFTRLGTLYNHAGDFASAEAAHRRALEIQERFLGKEDPALGVTIAAIALNMSNQGDKEGARRVFERAERLARQSSPDQYSRYLAYRSLHAAKYDNPGAGLQYIRQARDLRLEVFGPDSGEVGYGYFLEGDILDKAGDHAAAIDVFSEALRNFQRQSDPIWTAFAHEWLADSHRKLGNYETAEAYAARAAETVELVFGEGVRLGQALSKLASIQRDAGQTSDAMATFERAMNTALRDPILARHLQIDDVAPYLDLLLAEAERQPARADALRAKAVIASQIPKDPTTGKAVRLMAARLAESDPAVRGLARMQQNAVDAEQSARLELGREQLKDQQERDPLREQQLKERIQAASTEAARLERRLQAEFPSYGRLVASTTVPAHEIIAQLQPGEAVVHLVVATDATFAFLIDARGETRGHKVGLGAQRLQQLVGQLRAGLDPSRGLQPFDLPLAHRLHAELLGPFDAELAAVEHLIFVLTGPLLSLPPAVLVRTEPADGQDYQSASWLVRDLAISVLPSLAALRQLRSVAGESAAGQPFLGIGDPVLRGARADQRAALQEVASQCREDEPFEPAMLQALAPLPETRDELRLIAASLGAADQSLVLGAAASEPTVRSAALDRYRVIAFATHGLLPNELRCQSEPALVLTPPAVASERDDGLLAASEIAQLELDADWVVLSACNTAGSAGELGGESLSGLARAFFYAVARALLVSHWPVASQPTVALTTGTFERYARSGTRSKAEALRQAELALLDQPATAHPALWAPFVLVGDGGTRPAPGA